MKIAKVFLMLIVFSHFATKAQTLSFTVKASHPRILLDTPLIQRLQARASANTPEWQELQTRISGVSNLNATQIMNVVYEGQHYAIMHALSFYATGNTQHRDTAVSIFKRFFTYHTTDSAMYYDAGYASRSTLCEVAMLYDWLYNYLQEPFRTQVRTRLIHWGNWLLTKPNIYGMWGTLYYDEGNNYTMGHFSGITHLGFAIYSEDPVNGTRFIYKSDSIRPFLTHFTNTRLKHGDANEGWGYGAGYAANYFKALAVYKTATQANINHFVTTTYDEDVLKFLPMATLPDLRRMLPEGDWARESTGKLWDYHRLVTDLVSSYSNSTNTQRVAAFYGPETVPTNTFEVTAYRWFPFLFHNKEVAPLDYRTLPFYQGNYIYTDTSGTDQLVARTGWNTGSTWVSYRGGGRYGDHAHNGSGHFSVYSKGWLLIDKNIQAASGIEGSDSMHNCIHIERMNSMELYPFNGYQNAEHSQVKQREFTNDYNYVWTNAAPIYTARSSHFNNVVKKERQFWYFPALNKIAVYDVAATTTSGYKKWFGLTYNGAPSISNDSSYTFYSNAQDKALVYTAYPLQKQVTRYGNSIRVRNRNAQGKDYFMHLVSIEPASGTIAPVLPLNRDNGNVIVSDFYGSFHREALKDYAILFASDNTAFNYDSLVYEVPDHAVTLHSYIAGLSPNTTFYASYLISGIDLRVRVSKINHQGAIQIQSSSAGLLSFDLPGVIGVKENTFVKANFNVFYNASDKQIVVKPVAEVKESYAFDLYSIEGRYVQSTELNEVGMQVVSVNGLAAGVYVLKIQNKHTGVSAGYKLVIY